MFCNVSDPSLISLSNQLKPFVRQAEISIDFSRNLIHRLPKPGFRNVSEVLRTSTLVHSTLLHSTLLHSTNVSSLRETNVYKRDSRPKNLICSERSHGSGVLREVGGTETVVLRRAPKRYKTKHVWTMSPKQIIFATF